VPVRLIGARQLAVQLQRVVLAVQSPDAVRLLACGPLRRAAAGRFETTFTFPKTVGPTCNIRPIKDIVLGHGVQMKRRRPKQLELTLKTWGGKRDGAGRKPRGKKAGIPHRARSDISRHHPVHVTLRVASSYRNLRTRPRLDVVKRSVVGAERTGFRITDWSVQGNHIHLIVEAHDADMLGRGIRSFNIRTAKGINALAGRTGVVFPDRYHHHVLKTPRHMRSALCYVLNNALHHGLKLPTDVPDPYSSGCWFDGWRDWRAPEADEEEARAVSSPQSWLRTKGWRRHGLIGVGEMPATRSKKKS